MPGIEPRSQAWQPDGLLIEIKKQSQTRKGEESGAVRRHAESRGAERTRTRGAETGGQERARGKRSANGRKARFLSLGELENFMQAILYPGSAEGKPALRRNETIV